MRVCSNSRQIRRQAKQTPSDSVRCYLQEIGRFPLLSHEQEIDLGRQVQAMMLLQSSRGNGRSPQSPLTPEEEEIIARGQWAKEKMVRANLRLVVAIAKRYQNRGLDMQDLIQEGNLGLIRSVEKFDPSKGYRFSTYAYWWIRQGITRALSCQSRAIRLPVHLIETLNKIHLFSRAYCATNGHNPSFTEVGEALGMPPEKVRQALDRAMPVRSLDRPITDELSLADALPTDDPDPLDLVEYAIAAADVHEAMEAILEPKEQEVLLRSYGDDQTLAEIGRALGCSREWARQIKKKAANKIRRSPQANLLKSLVS